MKSFRLLGFYALLPVLASLVISCAHQTEGIAVNSMGETGGDATLAAQEMEEIEATEQFAEAAEAAANDQAEIQAADSQAVALLESVGSDVGLPSDAEIVAANTESLPSQSVPTSDAGAAPSSEESQDSAASEADPVVAMAAAAPSNSNEMKVAETEPVTAPAPRRLAMARAVPAPRPEKTIQAAPELAPIPSPESGSPADPSTVTATFNSIELPSRSSQEVIAPEAIAQVLPTEGEADLPDWKPTRTETKKVETQLASPDLSQFIMQNMMVILFGTVATGIIILFALRRGKNNSSDTNDIV